MCILALSLDLRTIKPLLQRTMQRKRKQDEHPSSDLPSELPISDNEPPLLEEDEEGEDLFADNMQR